MRLITLFLAMAFASAAYSQQIIPITNASAPTGFIQSVTTAPDGLYALFQNSTSGDTIFYSICKFNGSSWAVLEQLQGNNYHRINCIAYWNSKLYIGGGFFNLKGIAGATLVAAYSNGVFSAAGNGIMDTLMLHQVRYMTVFQNKLVVSGQFDLPGGTYHQSLAQWDGTSWTSLGALIYAVPNCPAPALIDFMMADGDKLYLQGDFKVAGSIQAYNIVYYQNGTYHALGTGFNNNWLNGTSAILKLGNDIITMCMVEYSPGQWDAGVVKWNGTQWSTVFCAQHHGNIGPMVMRNNQIFLGGSIDTATAAFDGLVVIENGINTVPQLLQDWSGIHYMFTYQNEVYVYGWFRLVGNSTYYSFGKVSTPTAVSDLPSDNPDFNVYPNPATTTVTISIEEGMIGSPPDDSRASTATVSDVTGRKMAAAVLSMVNSQWSMVNFANGVYFITVTASDGRSATKKLVVSK